MNKTDLATILTLLPPTSQIKVLRLTDTRGEALPEDFLADFPPVPAGVEYIDWKAEEKVLYRLERDGVKVKAIACQPLRVKKEGRDWTEMRTMDH
jgi:hypothetical protein